MLHLKRFTCEKYKQELLAAHEEIKSNRRLYVNSSFELIADKHCNDFNEMQREFEELQY